MLSSGHTTWYEQTLSIAIAMPPQKQTLLPQSQKYVTKLFICSHISRLNRASSRWGGENASPQKFFLEMSHIPHEANASRNQLNIVSIHHYLPTYLPTYLHRSIYLYIYPSRTICIYFYLPAWVHFNLSLSRYLGLFIYLYLIRISLHRSISLYL